MAPLSTPSLPIRKLPSTHWIYHSASVIASSLMGLSTGLHSGELFFNALE